MTNIDVPPEPLGEIISSLSDNNKLAEDLREALCHYKNGNAFPPKEVLRLNAFYFAARTFLPSLNIQSGIPGERKAGWRLRISCDLLPPYANPVNTGYLQYICGIYIQVIRIINLIYKAFSHL